MSAYLFAGGIEAEITLNPRMTEAEIGVALSRHPAVSFQAPSTDDNVAVSFLDGKPRIEFIGTLSGASSVRTIVSNSNTNPTVITTSVAHGFAPGQTLVIAGNVGSNAAINGTQAITAVLSPTTFEIAVDCTAAGGTGGTVYSTSQPAIADLDTTLLIQPKGCTGAVSFDDNNLAQAFQATTDDEITFVLHVKRTRASVPTTILSTDIVLNRELISGTSLSAPGGIASLFVKKLELGTGVMDALGEDIGTAGAPVLFDGVLGTPSGGDLAACTGFDFLRALTSAEVSITTTATLTGSAFGKMHVRKLHRQPASGIRKYG
jgi:hypothetical protein